MAYEIPPTDKSVKSPHQKKLSPEIERRRERRTELAATARRLVDLSGHFIDMSLGVNRIVLTDQWIVAVFADESEAPIIQYRE
jgi:hypothetical protein